MSAILGDTSSSLQSDCNVCREVMKMFTEPDTSRTIDLGSPAEALSTDCPKHKPVVDRLLRSCYGDKPEEGKDLDVGFFKHQGAVPNFTQSVSDLGTVLALSLAKRPSEPDHPGKGIILDPEWIDVKLAKEWKTRCLTSHGSRCDNPLKVWKTRPEWVVDLEGRCIVPGSEVETFVALSYRWGDTTGRSMDEELLAKLRLPNALDDPITEGYIAPIVRHAMHLTSVLGERFLWVDTLCIVHGSASTTDQLNLMGSIYANALVTIVAADGDADEGIKGLKEVSSSRAHDMQQEIMPFGDEKIMVQNTSYFAMIDGTPYYERGWTYQEHKLAKRKLLFNGYQMHWECHSDQWHEELDADSHQRTYIDPRLREILAGFPELDSFSHVVGNYNEQNLRYDEDALPAISGLLSVLSRSFRGGFLYGIPEMFFDRALAWHPIWSHTNLRQRVPSDRPRQLKLANGQLPSWSWIAWQGLVTCGDEAARINYLQSDIQETIPITQFYTGDSPETPPDSRRRIHSFWYDHRHSWKDLSKPLPDGWTRLHADDNVPSDIDEPLLWPEGCNQYVYRRITPLDYNWGPSDLWYYPFPIPDIQESSLPYMPVQTPYLFFRAQQVSVWARHPGDDDNNNRLSLHAGSGDRVGYLHLHNEEQMTLFPKSLYPPEKGSLIRVVSICLTQSYHKTWIPSKKKYGDPLTKKLWYNVLWLKWVGEVAYRLASGTVDQRWWDQLCPSDVEVILG